MAEGESPPNSDLFRSPYIDIGASTYVYGNVNKVFEIEFPFRSKVIYRSNL